MIVRSVALPAFALALFACTPLAAVSPALGGKNVQSTDNPLNGTAVQWSDEVRGVPLDGQRSCTTWPIENRLSVRATAERICVDGALYRLVDARSQREEEDSLEIQSDEGSAALDGSARKVGSCTDSTGTMSVWVTAYKNACVPNKDTVGSGPILSSKSKKLTVGDATWMFGEGGGGATAKSAPAPTETDAPNAATYKADVGKCMRGEPVDPGSLVGGPTCKKIFDAAKTGDDSKLPRGAREVFREMNSAK